MRLDDQFKTVTLEYADIRDSLARLEEEFCDFRRDQGNVRETVRETVREVIPAMQDRFLVRGGSTVGWRRRARDDDFSYASLGGIVEVARKLVWPGYHCRCLALLFVHEPQAFLSPLWRGFGSALNRRHLECLNSQATWHSGLNGRSSVHWPHATRSALKTLQRDAFGKKSCRPSIVNSAMAAWPSADRIQSMNCQPRSAFTCG